jgi:uncharacterized protein (TIGR03086 family)
MDTMELYRRAQDGFDAVIASVAPDRWDAPSMCTDWAVRDVAGHVIWGQRRLRAWALDEEYDEEGGPGSTHPAERTGDDPVATWRAARAAALVTLTEEALAKPVTVVADAGPMPMSAIVTLLTTDTLVHAWDIGHALGMDLPNDPALVSAAFDWTKASIIRGPGFFGPEITAPDGADERTRMLAFLGRAAWQSVAV